MKRRELILSAIVLALLVVVAGRVLVRRLLFDPIADKRHQVELLREERDLKARQVQQLAAAEKTLRRWRRQSLPPDVKLAPTMYLAWLTAQGEKAGFSGLEVSPTGSRTTNRGKEVVYYRYPCRIKGITTLAGLVDFLYAFYRAPLLHQVQQINISPAGRRAAGQSDVMILVDGLALVDADQWIIVPNQTEAESVTLENAVDANVYIGRREREYALQQQLSKFANHRLVPLARTKLIPDAPPSSDQAADAATADVSRLALADRDAYAPIVERNIFAPYAAPQAEPEGPDEALYYRLTAVRAVVRPGREVPEAMLYSPLDDDYVALRAGDEFEVADVRGRVVSIGLREVTLEIDQQRRLLRLGRNLRQLEALPGTEDAADDAKDAAPDDAKDAAADDAKDAAADDAKDAIDAPVEEASEEFESNQP
jgi:hypothetical protein